MAMSTFLRFHEQFEFVPFLCNTVGVSLQYLSACNYQMILRICLAPAAAAPGLWQVQSTGGVFWGKVSYPAAVCSVELSKSQVIVNGPGRSPMIAFVAKSTSSGAKDANTLLTSSRCGVSSRYKFSSQIRCSNFDSPGQVELYLSAMIYDRPRVSPWRRRRTESLRLRGWRASSESDAGNGSRCLHQVVACLWAHLTQVSAWYFLHWITCFLML